MPIRHAHLHRRGDGLTGFGLIAHEIDDASDAIKRRHVHKREPREFDISMTYLLPMPCMGVSFVSNRLDSATGMVTDYLEENVRIVYKTMEATFEGEVGGYKTVGQESKPTKAVEKESDDDDEEEEAEKKKEAAEEAKKEQKEEEEAKEKAQEAAKKKAEEAEKKKEEEEEAEEEEAKEKAKEDAEEKQKAKEEQEKKEKESSKAHSKTKEDEDEEPTTAKPTRTRIRTSSSEEPTSIPSVIGHPTDSQSIDSILAKATDEPSVSTAIGAAADLTGSSAISSSSATESASSGGSSTGAKAGIAFGVLGGLLAIGFLVFFLFRKRRNQAVMQKLENDDEKLHGPIVGAGAMGGAGAMRAMSPEAAETASVRTAAKAPRVSLRPVTQFLPNWNGLDKRTSKGAGMTLAVPGAAPTTNGPLSPRTPGGSAWERPSTAQSTDSANPFGAQAERIATPVQEETVIARALPASPVSQKSTIAVAAAAAFPAATVPVSPTGSASPLSPSSPVNDPLTANGPPVSGGAWNGAAAGAAAGAGAALLARKTSMRQDGPKHLDLTIPNPPMATVPASPAGTEFSTSSAIPGGPDAASGSADEIAAAGGPVNSAVYRVQLDFKPTLDDELGLRAGDLVRMLHEYDDGWALCIRLDRSRQGVVPRTCLSTRPVKPRPAQAGPRPGPPVKPAGPPRGPGPNQPQGQRPMTPQGNFGQGRPASPAGRPMTPNGSSPQSPMGPPMGTPGRPGPRSQSPGPFRGPPGGRSMSPGPGPGPRSQSPGPRQGPPGGRPMSPGPRSQSPGPAGGRSQSPGGGNRRNSPPGPSPMNPSQAPRQGPSPSTGSVNRKPVPGQAL
ncbi:hypothetical protein FZEAL_436 [Fusarium zealandicum]|uniref:SH3 domain-containing protein n=1 Tax=Fusarium zealandicum TaxID=1053134 RepID=A0A8H4XQW4_9HYPO|nr:hypothetical protein FZEAL_436 [Fusarium zealandicum]